MFNHSALGSPYSGAASASPTELIVYLLIDSVFAVVGLVLPFSILGGSYSFDYPYSSYSSSYSYSSSSS